MIRVGDGVSDERVVFVDTIPLLGIPPVDIVVLVTAVTRHSVLASYD
jgi:hypothetical protein